MTTGLNPKSNKQLQASANLFYEVFRQHDPSNLLLDQAKDEVLALELDLSRLVLSIAEQTLWLMPQHAVYWLEQETLVVADVHLGKISLRMF